MLLRTLAGRPTPTARMSVVLGRNGGEHAEARLAEVARGRIDWAAIRAEGFTIRHLRTLRKGYFYAYAANPKNPSAGYRVQILDQLIRRAHWGNKLPRG